MFTKDVNGQGDKVDFDNLISGVSLPFSKRGQSLVPG